MFWKSSYPGKARRAGRAGPSAIGFFLVEVDTNDSPLSPYWACRLCDAKGQPEFFAAAATSSAADHPRKIFESSQAADPDLSTDESERPKRRRLQYGTVPRARVKMIRELSLGLLINTNSRQSMGRLLDNMYESKKYDVKPELSDALTRFHLGRVFWHSVANSDVTAGKISR
uniref:Uncharacterized protein n=1 Tax=Fusarium oxysporum (strain Fo5176) TaxID=660025 RepID=A0A0C4BL14_FUSOF